MPLNKDQYDIAYADKLWALLPEVYRTSDSPDLDANGPLREMVNRIGAQAAILRRGIDRLWEDQSIETCDDWVIPYIADLLATNLVASLDARGQRLDVAKTIYYRRRKGTVAVLEEIAADITGWNVRVVEFFHRLSRTRHNFDPQIGLPSETSDPDGNLRLQFAEGIIGNWTRTAIGGTANLRNVYGSSRTQTAFDEFFHTADFRRGQGEAGWHNIPRLGVFLWRAQSFPIGLTMPIAVANCPGQFTFDPTGRDIQLFAAASRAFGDAWKSPEEWQLPAQIDQLLLQSYRNELYSMVDPEDGISVVPNALGVYNRQGSFFDLVPVGQITADARELDSAFFIDPARGRLIGRNNAPLSEIQVTYHASFPSTIGAGSYDRRILGGNLAVLPGDNDVISGGGGFLASALGTVAPSGTVTIDDFLTYTSVVDVPNVRNVVVRAQNRRRPLVRLPAPSPNVSEFQFTGTPAPNPGDTDGELVLEGLFVSGGEIVFSGHFDTITLSCCTLDPGNFDIVNNKYVRAADGRDLIPTRLWIDGGSVRQLIIDRCITGPIQTRNGGTVENMSINDSIVQAIGADKAIVMTGEVTLSRTTVLGKADLHRVDVSECILDDIVTTEDIQHGCVRFTAWSTGSNLPRKYESVEITPGSPLFNSRDFGSFAFAQLEQGADTEIIPPSPPPVDPPIVPPSILAGARDGSEMGAFARERNPVKERSLLIKYGEYMPLGLTPVLVQVT